MPNYHKDLFNRAFQEFAPQVTQAVATGDGDAYYYLQYVLDAVTTMAENTQDAAYLEVSLSWAEAMIATAVIVDKFGCHNWRGAWSNPNAPAPTCYFLSELQACTELARLAWIVHQNPLWHRVYGRRADAVLEWVLVNHVNKQLYKIGQLSYIQGEVNQRTNAISDKVLLLMATLAWANPVDPRYTDLLAKWLPSLKSRFAPFRDCILWDQAVFHVSDTTVDTTHANRVPALIWALWRTGDTTFTDQDRTLLSKLLTRVIWNGSITDPRLTNCADGTEGPIVAGGPAIPAGKLGAIYLGWTRCAAWSEEAKIACQSIYSALLAGQSNPTIDANSNYYARLALPSQLMGV